VNTTNCRNRPLIVSEPGNMMRVWCKMCGYESRATLNYPLALHWQTEHAKRI